MRFGGLPGSNHRSIKAPVPGVEYSRLSVSVGVQKWVAASSAKPPMFHVCTSGTRRENKAKTKARRRNKSYADIRAPLGQPSRRSRDKAKRGTIRFSVSETSRFAAPWTKKAGHRWEENCGSESQHCQARELDKNGVESSRIIINPLRQHQACLPERQQLRTSPRNLVSPGNIGSSLPRPIAIHLFLPADCPSHRADKLGPPIDSDDSERGIRNALPNSA